MTEFEIATLEISRTGLWISAVHAFISLIVGFGQCALIWYGLRLMQRGTERRKNKASACTRKASAGMSKLWPLWKPDTAKA